LAPTFYRPVIAGHPAGVSGSGGFAFCLSGVWWSVMFEASMVALIGQLEVIFGIMLARGSVPTRYPDQAC
jgi:hypothetical protein